MIDLWDHQKRGVELGLSQDNFAFFFEMGTGKTATTIHCIRHRCQENQRLMRTLILGPKAVLHNWKREFIVHSKIPNQEIIVLDQPGKTRTKKFIEAVTALNGSRSRGKIVIMNYEGMLMRDLVLAIREWNPEILVCDESQRCKSHTSKRAKQVAMLSERAKHRYLLSGTPILNNGMDIFQQFLILDNGATFGKNFFAFRTRWFEDQNAGWSSKPNYFPKFTPRPSTYKEFNRLIYKKAMRVTKDECLDLPPLVRETADIELSTEQRKLYSGMRDDYIAYVDDLKKSEQPRAVIAQLAITKMLRLQQIVSGFAKLDDGSIYVIPENPRLDVLKDYLEELTPGHKVIVWSAFHENHKAVSALCAKLKIAFTQYHGRIPTGEREDNLRAFREDPETRVLVASQSAGGVGINLTEASYSIFFSRTHSLEHDMQAEARNHRGGSEVHKKVTRIDLCAKDTCDESIARALEAKEDIAESILSWKL